MDIKNLTNELLIELFKEKECNLKRIESEFRLGKNSVGRLFNKRGIDYKTIKESYLNKIRVDYKHNPKLCKYCGKPIPYKDKNRKEFCNRLCSAIYNNIIRGNNSRQHNKFCLNCGKELTGDKIYNKYCCSSCLSDYQYKQYIKRWKQGLESGIIGNYDVSNYIRRYLFEKYSNSCLECGWNKVNPKSKKVPLQIHHIDGNCLNNTENNLLLLCPNCHSLTETYGNLNDRSNRIYRKQKKNT